MMRMILNSDHQSSGRSRVGVASAPEEAEAKVQELARYAVEATVRRVGASYALEVPLADVVLARHLLGLPPMAAPDRALTAGRRRAIRGRWPRLGALMKPRRLAVVFASGAALSLSLGTVLSTPVGAPGLAGASGWSAGGRAFHDDADGDGLADRIVEMGRDGTTRTVWVDTNRDGTLDRRIVVRAGESASVLALDDARAR